MSDKPNLLFRARLQLEEGNTQNALQILQEITSPDEQQQREIRYLTGWTDIQLKHWEDAITSLAPILQRAEEELKNEQAELTDREQLAHYLLQLGVAAINLEHYQDAILHLDLCLKVLHDRRVHLPRVRIQARYSLATAYVMRGLYPIAIQRYQEAARLCVYYDRRDELPNVYYGLAEAFRHAKDLASAFEYAQKALDIYRERKDREKECRIQNILGLICHLLGHQQEAAKYYNESTLLAILVNKPLIAMLNCAALADMYIKENDLSAARRHSDMAREYAMRLERPILLDSPYHISGKVAYADAQKAEGAKREELLKEAVTWYEKAIAYIKNTQVETDRAELYGDYAYALEDLGRQKEAIAFWRSGYQSLRDGSL